jgi:hypothetical protein
MSNLIHMPGINLVPEDKKADEKRDRILEDLRKTAIHFVDSAHSYEELRGFCRTYFEKSVALSKEHLLNNPGIVHEILERTLILYGECLVEATRRADGGDGGIIS